MGGGGQQACWGRFWGKGKSQVFLEGERGSRRFREGGRGQCDLLEHLARKLFIRTGGTGWVGFTLNSTRVKRKAGKTNPRTRQSHRVSGHTGSKLTHRSCHPQTSPSRKRSLVGCSSPFTRLTEHLTAPSARCKQCLPAWSAKTPRAPSRHCGDAKVYGHMPMAMYDIEYTPPPTPRSYDYGHA